MKQHDPLRRLDCGRGVTRERSGEARCLLPYGTGGHELRRNLVLTTADWRHGQGPRQRQCGGKVRELHFVPPSNLIGLRIDYRAQIYTSALRCPQPSQYPPVRNPFTAVIEPKKDERTKIISFSAGTVLGYLLPQSTDLSGIRFDQDPSSRAVALTDDCSRAWI